MRIVVFIVLALSQTACATAIRGVNEPFKVVSEPIGATVTTTLETAVSQKARRTNPTLKPNYYGCAPTPCEFIVPRRSKFIARIEKDGFEPTQIIVRSAAKLSGKTAGLSIPTTAATGGAIATASTTAGITTAAAALYATSAGLLTAPIVAVDASSGAMLSLYPNPVSVTLSPQSKTQTQSYDLDGLSDGNDTWKKRTEK